MNAWRWLGLSLFLVPTVCLLGTGNFSAPEAFAKEKEDKKVDISADPDKATVKPGESKTVDIKLKRGAKADKEVVLTAEGAPKDVTVKFSADKVAAKDSASKMTVETKDTVPEGDIKIKVKAKSDGSDTETTFTLTVKKEVVVKKETPPAAGAWKFKAFDTKGTTFFTEQLTKTNQEIKVQGQTVVQKQEQTFMIEWKVLEEKDGNYVVEQKIVGVKMEISIGGNKIGYDSTAANKQKNPMTDFFDKLTEQTLTFKIKKDTLAVTSIDGRQGFIDKLSEINPQMKSLLNAILSDKSLTKMAEPTWYAFPPGGSVPGDKKWSKTSELDLGPIGKYETTFDFSLAKTDGDNETIDISTKLKYTAPSEKSGLPFIIHKAELKGANGTGKTVFNSKTGRFESSDLTMKLTGNLEIEVGSMKTTVELTQDQTSSSKTLNALPEAWQKKK